MCALCLGLLLASGGVLAEPAANPGPDGAGSDRAEPAAATAPPGPPEVDTSTGAADESVRAGGLEVVDEIVEDGGPSADDSVDLGTSAEDLLAAYLQQIDAQQTLNGNYDSGVSESLAGMARLLEANGDHDNALAAYQQAMHIQRVNNGIYSLSQEPMLRGMISAYQARADIDNASRHYEQLHWLYLKTYGDKDPRLLPLVAEISNWHLNAYNQNPSRKGLYHLVRSHKLVASAIELVSHQFGGGTLTVLPLLRNLVVTNFYLADHQRRYPVGTEEGFSFRANSGALAEPLSQDEILVLNSYHNGRRAHESIINTLMNNPDASTLDKSQAMAELGDWYLLFGRTASAQGAYREAWRIAQGSPDTQPRLDSLFGTPRLISLRPATVVRDGPSAPGDATPLRVTLRINSRGEVKQAAFVDLDPEHHPELAQRANRELKQLRFRPRIVDGTMAASEDVPFALSMPGQLPEPSPTP
ncbi:MAG: tetratricopeptide repeat protein [Pseudomonadota bacterium]|nr:tetratricopeptide repeat protein [Pseudomonadota bacterium]